eukprot:gnl/TRDRNA2_/TRDRNA2_156801_c1_seq1.p1 gnl/TRDRNA2_/TRDRNA2_156801_c1~~gnl/TRDRNA2_/TRDRNA2_156801_c1_seq1.p1  ORF type:complete len:113 (-),score=10.70 gnl/TRDRNA2_/TRDRNA2_156801_c1_seq1:89-427(-)
MGRYPEVTEYSEKYTDDRYEYRHVILDQAAAHQLFRTIYSKNSGRQPNENGEFLLSEDEWRGLGVQQSYGWVHYAVHRPEPHVLLFRRPLPHAGNRTMQAIPAAAGNQEQAN